MNLAFENKVFSTNKILNLGGRLIDLSTPLIMGILNVTPDSFYDGGRFASEKEIFKHCEKLLKEGASIIDVGGYSSRPGAAQISAEEELARVNSAIKIIRTNFPDAIISIDTFRSAVAREAIHKGAHMVNDIAAGELDARMFPVIAELGVPYIMMHMRGTPQTMTQHTQYQNLVKEIVDFFHPKISALTKLGVKDLVIDPGFGFAKNIEQNFELLSQLEQLKILGKPILVGLSRKSMVRRTLGVKPDEALNGTTVLHTLALLKGANIIRVHDVKEVREVIMLLQNLPNI